MKYKTYKIKDLISEISMGPFGSNIKVECFVERGIPVLNGSNLTGFALNDNSFRYVTTEKADSLGKANAYRGDVVITHRGTLGQIVFIPENSKYSRYVISQSQFRVKCNEKILPEYLVYYFHTSAGQHKLLSNASQVGVPALARASTTFQTLEIDIPDVTEQRKIVDLLETIRDKIELNNKINNNLLEQASAVFNEVIRDQDKNGCIGDYCTVKSGFAFKSSWWQDTGIRVVKIGSINQDDLDLNSCAFVSPDKITFAKDFIVKSGDLLIAMTGATIGKFAMVPIIDEPILVNQRVGKFFLGENPVERLPFIYCQLKQDEIYNEIINRGQGSAQPNVSATDILNVPCVIPSVEEINKFNATVKPMFESIISNQSENQRLSVLRGTLLPRLMTGELDVSGIDL